MSGFVQFMEKFTASQLASRVVLSVVLIGVLSLLRWLVASLARRRISDLARFHHFRRATGYVYTALVLVLVGRIWIRGIDSIATFLGLMSAGLAIAMHDSIANLTGWVFILWRRPFKVGDRIEVAGIAGDVIDVRLFEFSLVEIRNWVDADQSTGRIIHVPNSKVLREALANYETGFEYIWHEIPVLITFESNWQKAKQILTQIAREKTEPLSEGAAQQIRRAAQRYLIFFRHLTPIVYTTVRDSGVLLTIRYIIKARQRRSSEQDVWEAVLTAFAQHDDIDLAYPTTRFYQHEGTNPRTLNPEP